jgi:hypothetical protein
MQPDVGFVLLTHSQPQQVVRLIARLNQLYRRPPICCHHDYSKCDLPAAELSGNVHVVRPHVRTRWAGFGIVEGTLRALRLMCERSDAPKWIVLLSGADYPIKPAARVLSDLHAGSFDAHMFLRRVEYVANPDRYQKEFQGRYFGHRVLVPKWAPHRGLYWKGVKIPRWLWIGAPPFDDGLRCYMGSQWFTIRCDLASRLLEPTSAQQRLRRHFL